MLRAFRALLGIVAFMVCAATTVFALEQPIPPPPTQWVTDTAGFLSPQTVRDLNARLASYESETHHQVLVYVGSTTGDTPLEDWTVHAFQRWQVGRKGLDDGLVLFVFSRDRKLRVEVGYGLEAVVPDAVAARIIRDSIAPRLAAGDPDGGVRVGVDQLLRRIGGEASSQAEQTVPVELTIGQSIVALIMFIGLLLVVIRSPWMVVYLLFSIIGGRGGGGEFPRGGGFTGGGGRSGGGGASGSW